MYLIKSTWFLRFIFTIMSPFIDTKTKEKMKFIKVEDLKYYFDEDKLLQEHGGTCFNDRCETGMKDCEEMDLKDQENLKKM